MLGWVDEVGKFGRQWFCWEMIFGLLLVFACLCLFSCLSGDYFGNYVVFGVFEPIFICSLYIYIMYELMQLKD